MTTIHPIGVSQGHSQNKDNSAAVAGGCVAAGGTQAVGRKVLSAEKNLRNMLETVSTSTRTIDKNMNAFERLYQQFKINTTKFSADLVKRAKALENVRILGSLIKSPLTRGLASFAGGALAFFVLVTGIRKATENGSIAVNDIKDRILNEAA